MCYPVAVIVLGSGQGWSGRLADCIRMMLEEGSVVVAAVVAVDKMAVDRTAVMVHMDVVDMPAVVLVEVVCGDVCYRWVIRNLLMPTLKGCRSSKCG